jgi:hypothetical protein
MNKSKLNNAFDAGRIQGIKSMLKPGKKKPIKTKEEIIWRYLLKRCDTSYEARLMYNAIVRALKSNRPTELFDGIGNYI